MRYANGITLIQQINGFTHYHLKPASQHNYYFGTGELIIIITRNPTGFQYGLNNLQIMAEGRCHDFLMHTSTRKFQPASLAFLDNGRIAIGLCIGIVQHK